MAEAQETKFQFGHGLFIDIGIPADLERAQTLLALQARAGRE